MNKKISEIGINIHNLVLKNSHDFSSHYFYYEKDFLDWHKKFTGLKNDVRPILRWEQGFDLVRLSVLLSDFTSIFPYNLGGDLGTSYSLEHEGKIRIPNTDLEELTKEHPNGKFYVGFKTLNEEELEDLFTKLYPLVECGKILIRPEKVIYVHTPPETPSGFPHLHTYPADSNGDAEVWRRIGKSREQRSFPIFDSNSVIEHYGKISEVFIPFIGGINLTDYSKILLDEEDILSSFRAQTKSYMEILKKGDVHSEEFKRDVIQPKLDLIGRKFKTITNNHRLKVAGATFGTVGLQLLSLSQAGLAAALSQLISFGLGTVGFVKSEVEYQENIDKLRDIPEYLLWKINKQR